MTLVEKDKANREISLGCGNEEREKESKERERHMGRSLVCDGLVVVVFAFCLLQDASPTSLSSAFSVCVLAGCAQDHAFPQLPWHVADSCAARPGLNMRQSRSNAHANS
jgi:hypothetical protein